MKLQRPILLGAALVSATLAHAQQPRLVRDVNEAVDPGPSTFIESVATTSSAVYFSDQTWLWRVNATTVPTKLGPAFGETEAVGDVLFGNSGTLFRTDGTPAGTLPVPAAPSNPTSLTNVAGTLFFVAPSGPQNALVLWKTEGTGTLPPTPIKSISASGLVAVGNRLFFVGSDGATGSELWTSDGTPAGTRMVADLCPGPCSGMASTPVDMGGQAFFAGSDGVHVTALWRSDGTAPGTSLVKDIAVPGSLAPRDLAVIGDLLVFRTGTTLWRSDGTEPGTFLLRQLNFGQANSESLPPAIFVQGNRAFVSASEAATGRELWVTDGSVAGTVRVTDVCPGTCSFLTGNSQFGTVGDGVVFSAVVAQQLQLWHSDGTTAGTTFVKPLGSLPPTGSSTFTSHGPYAYFVAADDVQGRELWRTDGPLANTVPVTEAIDSDSDPLPLDAIGDRYFFTATRPDTGRELWTTTGSTASTTLLEVAPGPADAGISGRSAALGGDLLFAAAPGGQAGLWKTDGTPSGTTLVSAVGVHSNLAILGGVAFFGGGPGQFADELWRSDGTPGGTYQVVDQIPGASGPDPHDFVALDDRVLFILDRDGDGTEDTVWRTDGTAEGTRRVTSFSVSQMERVGGRVFMTHREGSLTTTLWVTEGTADSTRLVADIGPYLFNNFDRELVAADDILYFTAYEPSANRVALWKSDGTTAGTGPVQDRAARPLGVTALTWSAGQMFFIGSTSQSGSELWRSDGTSAGTFMVRDILPGPASAMTFEGFVPATSYDYLAAVPGGVVFAATSPGSGSELWFSDGTKAGTVPYAQIEPGLDSSSPNHPRTVGPHVFFGATLRPIGNELWAVDLPAAVIVADASVVEANSGTVALNVPVSLTAAAAGPVVVSYTTVEGTATSGVDFQPQAGTLTFVPGSVGPLTVTVPVAGDLLDEPNETLTVQLTGVTGAATMDDRALGVIVDDDGPTIAAAGATVVEGDSGTVAAAFDLTLATSDGAPVPIAQRVRFSTEGATATSGIDFIAQAGVLTFAAGTPSGTVAPVTVPVRGDTADEPDEFFRVLLEPVGDEVVQATVLTGHVLDDDGAAAGPPLELTRGAAIRATLAPPFAGSDRDWYLLQQAPRSSYELVVDEVSGDAVPLEVLRMGADGSTVQTAIPIGTGGARSLRWQNTSSTAIVDQPISVASAACGTTCGADDAYRIRLYETTLAAARYNNQSGQVTVVVLQNASDAPVDGRIWFWGADTASLELTQPFTIPARGGLVLNTAPLQLAAGSLTVMHDGPYGSLVGKTVALQPSTGFSFDTPLTPRPR